jgi:pilus assembly protein CpaF
VSDFPAHRPLDWRQETGPLQALLVDPTVTEIMVNGPYRIFVEKSGRLIETATRFDSHESLMKAIQAMITAVGKEINRKVPCVDARLPDGSRINCVIPPVSLDGPILTIRKFPSRVIGIMDLVNSKALDAKMAYFLKQVVASKLNVLICGGTGTGKTTILNALSGFIPQTERVITIEDTPELKLASRNLVRMEARPKRGNDPGISIQELLVNALRMRPDRIIVGECRGVEAWDMLVAMNTGHEGSMTTIHANSARDGLRRLEAMVLLAAVDMPVHIIRQNVADTLDVVVQLERASDGQRRIVEIVEICGYNNDNVISQEIFNFDHKSETYASTGSVPEFVTRGRVPEFQFPKNFWEPSFEFRIAA